MLEGDLDRRDPAGPVPDAGRVEGAPDPDAEADLGPRHRSRSEGSDEVEVDAEGDGRRGVRPSDVRVLVGRYELQEPIGAGATGRVYAALDTRLGRMVAVKALHASLAHDGAFLSRFQREVSIAGKLSHANIVHVYDWGTDDDVPFLVTELLPGGSLAAFLERGGRLEVAQAAALGHQVARALEHAHAQGVIHRDIKPANLLFDEHGAIRVADFGLARALADATPTLPSEAVFGTLRYASPEQASAEALDGRTDLYSLALVLVEAVTGHVPFAAESPAQMLTARTREPIPTPFELGRLRPVIELAGRPDPDDRYATAAEMARDLAAVVRALPAAEALPTSAFGFDDGPDPHPTEVAPAVGGRGLAHDDTPSAGGAASVRPGRHRRRPPTGAPASAVPVPRPVPTRQEEGPPPAPARTRSGWVAPLLILAAVAVAAVVAGLAARGTGPTKAAVPNVVGLSQAEALTRLQANGLAADDRSVEHRFTHDAPGMVIGQSPEAGARVPERSGAQLVVSDGPQMTAVPDLSQGDEAAARATLAQLGLEVTAVSQDFDETVPPGRVLRQDPPIGTSLEVGSPVSLVISNGPVPRTIPDLTSQPLDAATAALDGVQLVVGQTTESFDDTVPAGQVISQDPAPNGQAARGTAVNLVVSKGPELMTVPPVIGLGLDAAVDQLDANRLPVGLVSNFARDRKVVSTSPAAGAQVRPGTPVNLAFG